MGVSAQAFVCGGGGPEIELGKSGCLVRDTLLPSYPSPTTCMQTAAGSFELGIDNPEKATVGNGIISAAVAEHRTAERLKLTNRHAAHKCLNGALGTRVDGVLGHTLGLSGDGAHEDQPSADLEVLVRLARHEELAARVDVEDAVELLRGDVLDVAERHHAAVGADNVELAEDLDGLLEHAHDLVDVRHVGLDRGRVRAGLLDGLHDLLGRLLAVGVVDDDFCAAAAELEGHLSADSAPLKPRFRESASRCWRENTYRHQ